MRPCFVLFLATCAEYQRHTRNAASAGVRLYHRKTHRGPEKHQNGTWSAIRHRTHGLYGAPAKQPELPQAEAGVRLHDPCQWRAHQMAPAMLDKYGSLKIGGAMTLESRITAGLDDAKSLVFECAHCGSKVTRDLASSTKVPHICGQCGKSWRPDGAAWEQSEAFKFLQALPYVINPNLANSGFRIRFEFDAANLNQKSPASKN